MEVDISCFLWTGEVSKRDFSNMEWAKCCAPNDKGGFGIRSIRLANTSFICKLVWDVLTSTDALTHLLKERYFYEDGRLRNLNKRSSIRSILHAHMEKIEEGSFWMICRHSKVKLWTDN